MAQNFSGVGSGVCGVVVTFRPPGAVVENLAILRPQVAALVVVDNGSSSAELAAIAQARTKLAFTLIENGDNLGIAAALNVGARWARDHGFAWIAFFDQDSTVTEGYIDALLAAYAQHPERTAVGLLAGTYRDRETGASPEQVLFAADGAPVEIMTSGSLLAAHVLENVGWFREDFFIDQVDHEYCFRLRNRGWIIIQRREAVLLHVAGRPRRYSLFGKHLFTTTNHSAGRYYYITRNGLVMMLKYARAYPAWSYNTAVGLALLPIKVVLAEEHSAAKLWYIARGAVDAIFGRMGRVVRL